METILKDPKVELIDYRGEQLDPAQLLKRIANLGFCITDHQGFFVEVNDQYTQIYGYSREELVGQHFTKVLPEEFKNYGATMHDNFIAGEVEMPAEWQVMRKDGGMMRINAEAIRVVNEGGASKLTVIEQLN